MVSGMSRYRGMNRKVPQGTQEVVALLAHEGVPTRALAARFGLSHSQVQGLAKRLEGMDFAQIAAIRRGLPGLQTVLSAALASKAMDMVDEDPKLAVNLAFGSKVAIEAVRTSAPAADAPSQQMRVFIEQMNVAVASRPEIIDIAEVSEQIALPENASEQAKDDSPGDDTVGAVDMARSHLG